MRGIMGGDKDQCKIPDLFPNVTESSTKNRHQAQGIPRRLGSSSAGAGTGHGVLESPDVGAIWEMRGSAPGRRQEGATPHCRAGGAGLRGDPLPEA